MPNHITNRVRISLVKGADPQAFLDSIASERDGERQHVDFKKIIAPPDNMFRGPLSLEKERELDTQGIPHWLGWQRQHWGTKWNAYQVQEPQVDTWSEWSTIELQFDTAWACPEPILEALAARDDVEHVAGHWVDEFSNDAGVFNIPRA